LPPKKGCGCKKKIAAQAHHFELIKEGYVGTLSSVDNPTFDHFKRSFRHLLKQHKIEEIQLPNVISDVQTHQEKPKKQKKKK